MKKRPYFTFIFSLFTLLPAFGQLTISKLFADHAVLQRDRPIKVWGWADAKSSVTVIFNEQKYTTQVNENGKWMVNMPAMGAGGPYTMTIQHWSKNIELKDILIGDVWICSGQSNMEWTVANSNNATYEIQAANDNHIRHFKVPNSYANTPEEQLAGGQWQVTTPQNVKSFTAVGYFFAKELRKHVKIPIGLLNTSWSGSKIEPWMSAGTLNMSNTENALQEVIQAANQNQATQIKELITRFPDLSTEEKGIQDSIAVWAKETIETSKWVNINVPNNWESQGYRVFDGIAWYRTSFYLSEKEAQSKVILSLGKIDDSDKTWVNGQKVGETTLAWNKLRYYEVSPQILKAGKNTIAIRVEDPGGGGGIHGDPNTIYIQTSTQKINLSGVWDFRLDAIKASLVVPTSTSPSVTVVTNGQPNHTPTLVYNKMIFPLLNFGIKGALWYQGESNAFNETEATEYSQHFINMIKSWRNDFGDGDFPFLYVQLANWLHPKAAGAESSWATLRASQTEALTLNNTAQVVTIDIGEANDIHPKNKQDVGIRLSLAARHLAYGQTVLYQNPMYKSHYFKDGKIHLSFDHIGYGLIVKDKNGFVNGFALAGEDGKFVWAKAKLTGKNTIVVWSDAIPNPTRLRYAWADNPSNVHLYNSAGLPACPFKIGE